MKVVLDKNGEVLGRYVRTNATTYTACLQDDYEVPKAGNRVVTFSAVNGDGIVYRHPDRNGNINVRKGPSIKSAVVAKIPDTGYDLLGINWSKGLPSSRSTNSSQHLLHRACPDVMHTSWSYTT